MADRTDRFSGRISDYGSDLTPVGHPAFASQTAQTLYFPSRTPGPGNGFRGATDGKTNPNHQQSTKKSFKFYETYFTRSIGYGSHVWNESRRRSRQRGIVQRRFRSRKLVLLARRQGVGPGLAAHADHDGRKLLGNGMGVDRFQRQRLQGDGSHAGLPAGARDAFGGRPLLDRTTAIPPTASR